MNTRVLLGITEVLWGNEWSSVIVAEPLGQGVWRLKLRSYRTAGEPLKRLLVKFFPRGEWRGPRSEISQCEIDGSSVGGAQAGRDKVANDWPTA